jgi:methyltransferase (TIGR00027 family)
MDEARPSFTAEVDAAIRTYESDKPESERLCHDPFAGGFLGPTNRFLGAVPPLRKLGLWYLERKHPFVLDCIPARTRYIDDYVSACIDEGLEQLVILGAGYDSRAYRLEELTGRVTVFEVDHPATQKRKLELMTKMLGHLPGSVVYVPTDFNQETLAARMAAGGYDPGKKSLFIWEGVTPLITREAVDETLKFIAENSGPGSSVIFNYILKSMVDGTCEAEGARKIRKAFGRGRLLDFRSNRGDRLLFGLEEGTVGAFLHDRGFHQVREVSGDFYESQYFTGPNRNRKGCSLCWVVKATVKSDG